MPYASPSFTLLCVFRATMSFLMRLVLVSPLMLDYVKSESRGLGMSLVAYGHVFGELIMIVLFGMTRQMEMKE